MTRNTYHKKHTARLGLAGTRTCVVPDQVAEAQRDYDGKTFKAILPDGSRMRVRLIGSDYGLHTGGTGDMIVRPIARL